MIDEVPIEQSARRIDRLLQAAESRVLEFKRVSGKMVGRALETVCAFANSEGGLLVLGIADPSYGRDVQRIFGVEENREALDELQRKLLTQFDPPLEDFRWFRIPHAKDDKSVVHLALLRIEKSDRVHTIIGDGTWTRMNASNRQMMAREIAELAYRRGERSAESEPMPVDLSLLDTATWRTYAAFRGLSSGDIGDQLVRVGLADRIAGQVQPRRAAVLLFADEPGGLLAAQGARAELRLFIYKGTHIESGATPNLRKPPKTFRSPLVGLIEVATRTLEDELAEGLKLAASGFETLHRYPMRVIKEAIANAVIHRDYRLNRDIFVRIFDDRVEVESPGAFPGSITPANIAKAGSKARNPLIARTLFDFPVRHNIDAGEGVRMMFSEMAKAGLYPPQYREGGGTAGDTVTVILLNEERPALWEQVSDWIDRNGPIANADLCRIGHLDTLKASKMLKRWVDQNLLEALPNRGKRNMAYRKPADFPNQDPLLSNLGDNNGQKS